MARPKKPRKDRSDQKYALVDPNTQEGQHLAELVKTALDYSEHKELAEAKIRIAPAWLLGLKPNRDGQVIKAKVKICGELERIQKPADLVIMVNQEWWRTTDDKERLAELDDKLCRVNVVPGPDGMGAALNGHGLTRLRKRLPDMVAFKSVLARHGSYDPMVRQCVDVAMEADTQMALPGTGTLDRSLRIVNGNT